MELDHQHKLCTVEELAEVGRRCHAEGRAVVLCHGCFDVIHPGHLRYLRFARQQADVMVVSITGDDAIEKSDGLRPYVPQELRAEGLAALECVDHVAIVEAPTAEPVIEALRPEIYVKGKEYEQSSHPGFLAERRLVEARGGRVVYSSGDVVFSSTDLIGRMASASSGVAGQNDHLASCCQRWRLDVGCLSRRITHEFHGKRVLVIGDAIVDRYVLCDGSGVTSEAPVLSVRPAEEISYLGGAAIIAAHLKGLGAEPHLVTSLGHDPASGWLLQRLETLGITATSFPARDAAPLKRRYLVEGQKLLKVDEAPARPLDSLMQRKLIDVLADLAPDADAAIFADFGCGTVTTSMLQQAIPLLRPHVGTIAADISGERQTLLACQGVDLLTPAEHELRGVLGDSEQSLPTLVSRLMQRLGVGRVAVTMGPRGCVLFQPRERQRDQWFRSRLRSAHIPALNGTPADPLGAGDAFLATATLATACSADLTEAGYLGSLSAAMAAGRLGNQPLDRAELLAALRVRSELQWTGVDAGVRSPVASRA